MSLARRPRALILASLAATSAGCVRPAAPDRPVLRVAAASDLADVFAELAARFEARTGARVALTFGSSGNLALQLAEGAPWDLFASADASFAERAVASGRCASESRAPYARGRLAAVARPGLAPPTSLEALGANDFARIAVANPGHAPYGRAALEALDAAGILPRVRPRLVFADNVRQAMQLAESGNADGALVARALVPPGRGALVVPAAMHQPLRQVLVRCPRGGVTDDLARRFADLVTGPEGREALSRRGFDPPEG